MRGVSRPDRTAWPTAITMAMFLALLLTVTLGGCGGEADEDSAAADSTAAADTSGNDEKPKKKEKAIKVNLGEIRQGDLVLPVYADGAVRTPLTVQIRTKVGGEMNEVLVRDGDQVRKGQLLGRIDPREYAISLEESRFRHYQALSQMAAEADTFTVNHDAQRAFEEGKQALDRLRRQKTISNQEYQSRLLELEMGALQQGAFRQEVFQQRTGLAEARMAEQRAQLNLEYTEIRAPFSGTVRSLNMVIGENIAVGTAVCEVFNNEHLEAVVNVLEADLGNLVEGRPVLLAVPATRDTLQAQVDVISPSIDQATRTCEVIIRFDNPAGRYRPGMFVRAEIAGWIHTDKLLAPKAALLTRDNRPLVFKANGDRAQWLYVDVGLENDAWFEILKVHSGGSLAPGDEVVVSDHLTLAHEALIKVRKRVPPASRWDFAVGETELP